MNEMILLYYYTWTLEGLMRLKYATRSTRVFCGQEFSEHFLKRKSRFIQV